MHTTDGHEQAPSDPTEPAGVPLEIEQPFRAASARERSEADRRNGHDAATPRNQTPARGEVRPQPRRVLVIDDDILSVECLCDALELSGNVVEAAYRAPEGLEKARAMKPDVVVCDVGLPGMNGFEVARALRADPAFGRTLLVCLTGYARPEDIAQAKAAGFDEHFTKPADPEALEKLFAAHVGRERRDS